MSEKIYDLWPSELKARLVGKSIVSIENEVFTMSDGTVLELEDTGDCCAYFGASVNNIDLTDNVVVRCEGSDIGDHGWKLSIFSAHKLIADVNVDGDPTSGYYCHSVNLIVKEAVK